MDWSRAKTVLILAFLLLNALLGYQLWMDELNLSTFTENAAKRDEMNRVLNLKGIQLNSAVPEWTPVLSEITVSLRTEGMPDEPKPMGRPFARTLLQDYTLIRNALLTDVPEFDAYEPDPYASRQDGALYVLNQLYGQLPMFEMRLALYGDDEMVHSYAYRYAEVDPLPAHPGTQAGQEVLSAYVVVSSLAENYLPAGASISHIRLGYRGPIFESETQVLAPYWRVVLHTGETYHMHAVNGAVEVPTSKKEDSDD